MNRLGVFIPCIWMCLDVYAVYWWMAVVWLVMKLIFALHYFVLDSLQFVCYGLVLAAIFRTRTLLVVFFGLVIVSIILLLSFVWSHYQFRWHFLWSLLQGIVKVGNYWNWFSRGSHFARNSEFWCLIVASCGTFKCLFLRFIGANRYGLRRVSSGFWRSSEFLSNRSVFMTVFYLIYGNIRSDILYGLGYYSLVSFLVAAFADVVSTATITVAHALFLTSQRHLHLLLH